MTDRRGQARAWLGRRVREKLSTLVAEDPGLGATRVPYASGDPVFTIPAPPPGSGPGGPRSRLLPPADRWELPDQTDPEVYLATGQRHAGRLVDVLDRNDIQLGASPSVLDFGCGYGRVLRWMLPWAEQGEVWGADLDGERVEWARRCLGPPFRFVTVTSQPHLPFEDRSFDLVHAASVLPHIADGADAWMLELRRVTRPGGHLYVTIYDEHTAELVRSGEASPGLAGPLAAAERSGGRLGMAADVIALSRRPGGAQVFRSRAWIERVWGAWFEILAFEPEAHHAQTAVLLRKR